MAIRPTNQCGGKPGGEAGCNGHASTINWLDVSSSRPCPICEKADWCRVSDGGQQVCCRRCDRHPSYGAGKRKTDTSGGEFYYYDLRPPQERGGLPEPTCSHTDGGGKRAGPDTLHRVYSAFLKRSKLSGTHREAIRARGLTNEALQRSGCKPPGLRSLGLDRVSIVAGMVRDGLEHLLPGVPGFYVKEQNGRRYWSVAGPGGLLIPVRDVQGRIVALLIRPDKPVGDNKYVWLSSKRRRGAGPGAPAHVPQFDGDKSRARVTEGGLKAIVATVLSGVLTVGLSGVNMWARASRILRDLGVKKVVVALDADASSNPNVAKCLVALVGRLRERGFEVELELWDAADGKGIDDLLAAGKAPEVVTGEVIDRALQEIAKAAAASGAGNTEDTQDEYFEQGGCLWRTREDKGPEKLCDFTAVIVEEQIFDDGSTNNSPPRHYRIAGKLANGQSLPDATVPTDEFGAVKLWAGRTWGAPAVVRAGRDVQDHVRAAIQLRSNSPPVRTVYEHIGWRQADDRAWLYVHAGGAIGSGGQVEVSVQFDEPATRYRLPDPRKVDLRDAARATVALLGVAEGRVITPALAAAFRAPLGSADISVFLYGRTGVGKSELSALIQQHYGAGFRRTSLPGSWTSTENNLEATAYVLKDAVFCVDDFKLSGGRQDDALHEKADRLLRAQGNNSGRGRCGPSGERIAAKPPRGLILASGEDLPRGESLKARVWAVEVRPREVRFAELSGSQKAGASGAYAGCMAGYLRWLAGRYDEIRNRLPDEHAEFRSRAAAGGHPRLPGAQADLFLGFRYFLEFAREVGAVSELERGEYLDRAWEALANEARSQAEQLADRDPARRYLRLLASLVKSGRCYIKDHSGGAPGESERWGWRIFGERGR